MKKQLRIVTTSGEKITVSEFETSRVIDYVKSNGAILDFIVDNTRYVIPRTGISHLEIVKVRREYIPKEEPPKEPPKMYSCTMFGESIKESLSASEIEDVIFLADALKSRGIQPETASSDILKDILGDISSTARRLYHRHNVVAASQYYKELSFLEPIKVLFDDKDLY